MKKKTVCFKVKCDKCGEIIEIRVNPETDINEYVLNKEILGNNCPQLIYARISFDRNYNIIDHKIMGGKLATSRD